MTADGRLVPGWTVVSGLRMHGWRPRSDAGHRPAVVVVHGLGAAGEAQLPVASQLSTDLPVYVPDLPGYGHSDHPPAPYGVPELARSLGAWLGEVGVERPVCVANSVGCQVVTELAVTQPDRIGAVVLQGPTFDPAARAAPPQVGRFLRDSLGERPSLGWVQLRGARQAGPTRLARSFRLVLADRIHEKLPRLSVPALVVRGARDPIVPQRWAEQAAELAPRGELRVVPGAPHSMVYSAPLELARLVRGFLQRLGDQF